MVKNEVIHTAQPQDCLLGRGHSLWPGNMRYRQIISGYRTEYERATMNREKKDITFKIVEEVCKNGGRFLKEDPVSGTLTEISKASARLRVGQVRNNEQSALLLFFFRLSSLWTWSDIHLLSSLQALRHQLRSSRGIDDAATTISQAAKKQEAEAREGIPIETVSFNENNKVEMTSSSSSPSAQTKEAKNTPSLRSIFDDTDEEVLASEDILDEDLEPTPIRNLPIANTSHDVSGSPTAQAPFLVPYSPTAAASSASSSSTQEEIYNNKNASGAITIEQLLYAGNFVETLIGQLRKESHQQQGGMMIQPRLSTTTTGPFHHPAPAQDDETNNDTPFAAALLQSSIGEWSS